MSLAISPCPLPISPSPFHIKDRSIETYSAYARRKGKEAEKEAPRVLGTRVNYARFRTRSLSLARFLIGVKNKFPRTRRAAPSGAVGYGDTFDRADARRSVIRFENNRNSSKRLTKMILASIQPGRVRARAHNSVLIHYARCVHRFCRVTLIRNSRVMNIIK